jgi:phosphoribosylamine--glycine ligase
MQTAEQALEDMLGEKAVFGDAGAEVVIEEFMIGEEASIFAICDGENYVLLSPAQDHKQVNDGDKGLNTGGMGAYAPAPVVTPEVLKEVETKIIKPTLEGMRQEKAPYKGVLYVGIMVTEQGSKVVEYNCRFGDPECQILLPLYSGDVLELLYQAATGNLSELKVASNEGSAAIVVLASEGYPGSYPKGRIISGIDTKLDGVHIIHAGTKKEGSSIVTSGGRVLGVVGQGDSLQVALDKAYNVVNKVSFDGAHYRTDIGKKGLDKFLT